MIILKKTKSSVLVASIVTLFFLSFLIISCWRRSSFDYDIAIDRSVYYKNLYTTEIILNYGIKIAKQFFYKLVENIKKNKTSIELDLSFLLRVDDEFNQLSASCLFSYNCLRKELILTSTLKSLERSVFKLKCIVIKVVEDDFEKPGATQFIVQNYTICPTV
jgi:hypothetical protein